MRHMKTKLFALAFAILAISSLHTLAQEPGTLLWSYNATNLITTSPAIAPDGTIYIGSYAGFVAITNAGSNKWTFAASPAASPTIGSDGTIYFTDNSAGAKLYAVNPNGSQKWMYSLQEAYPYVLYCNSSPAIGMDGSVYVEAGGRLYAFTAAGAKKWDFVIDDDTSARMALFTLRMTVACGRLSRMDKPTGA
jgi:outer membrane protein assembly factor BamB